WAARGAVGPRGGAADRGPPPRPRPRRLVGHGGRARPLPVAVQEVGPRRARDLHRRGGRPAAGLRRRPPARPVGDPRDLPRAGSAPRPHLRGPAYPPPHALPAAL